MILLTFIFMFC